MFREVVLQTHSDIYIYREEDKLGEGGFGCVYLGQGVKEDVKVAIKRPHFYSPESLKRFKQKECRYLPLLRHRNIVKVFDVLAEVRNERGESGPPALIMEYIEGKSLQACWKNYVQKLSYSSKLELFSQICHAVDYAHCMGIVHRDLKPNNILIDVAGNPKIIDFGLAGNLNPNELRSHTHKFMGSLLYMAPEQHESSGADQRSDIYSLGLILFFIFTGRHAKEKLLEGKYTLEKVFDKYLPRTISGICKCVCQWDRSKRCKRVRQILSLLPARAKKDNPFVRETIDSVERSLPHAILVGIAWEQVFRETPFWQASIVAAATCAGVVASAGNLKWCFLATTAFLSILASFFFCNTAIWYWGVAITTLWSAAIGRQRAGQSGKRPRHKLFMNS